MYKFVLCGHTGSMNRGSDAIVKSTADLIHRSGGTVVLASYHKNEDIRYGVDEYDDIVTYADLKSAPILRLVSLFFTIIKKNKLSARFRQRPVIHMLKKGKSVSLVVGGDTYCYGIPYQNIQMNAACKNNDIATILWACSIEEEAIKVPEILDDLKRYTYIFPREQETYQYLVKYGIDEKKLVKMCDPAFTLLPESVEVPWMDSGTSWIGMNISPVISFEINKTPGLVIENYRRLVQYILDTSKDNVVFIPHVYIPEDKKHLDDITLQNKVIDFFRNDPKYVDRVVGIEKFYNSKQLKYIISKCKILFTARTHVSIAGYSSYVPTFVIGYSIKALGIAMDLFGDTEHYVELANEISRPDELIDRYKWIDSHQAEIRQILQKKVPEYQHQAYNAAEFLCNKFN